MEYISLSDYLKNKYGTKVYKLSLTSGCTCPNRDGTISTGGCIFCSEGGSGDFAAKGMNLAEQICYARELVDKKISSKIPLEERKYIAYFQSFTNTYGDQERLMRLFSEVLSYPEIVGLSIGTRPDCLSDEMIEHLSKLNLEKEVWVELGLQTIHENTSTLINRGYLLQVFEDAYKRLTDAGLKVVVHVILGLPGESKSDIIDTIDYLAKLTPRLFGVKLQLLHILMGTKLADMYQSQPFHIYELDEYCELVCECLRHLPPETVVHRLTGDGPKRLLIAPLWSGNKKVVMNTMREAIKKAHR
ncbi:TIGR01212 family radical SAM protein [Pseudobutyrivibrio xylanivorans]|uniref:TIGR01212 family radical SAM protein n=1 Tax=Pseudobutyrivibrio xylanivorans TaxID=185007 RepID=A0A5P6VU50_PSEXY|nr:TIGR01212 family radical SAM protein [Pseudobutyrivibrio xylanivorans]QFJ55838.1 TIGR01212 family radical SAM protein [Pseudobutyrivibrio xylanivorans]